MTFTPVILVHVTAALGAVAVGALMLTQRKGTRLHKLGGRLWVALMLITALGSFAIRSSGHLSWIHLLSVWVLVSLTFAIAAIMRRDVRRHRIWMTGTYSGLVIAGIVAMVPGRMLGGLLWQA